MNPHFLQAIDAINFLSPIHHIGDIYIYNEFILIETIDYLEKSMYFYWDGNLFVKTLILPNDSILISRDIKTRFSVLSL